MKLLLLGGNSLSNKEWITDVASAVESAFEEIKVHMYRHWEIGNEMIDLDLELDRVQGEIKSWEKYAVFAKSAGSLLVLKGVHEGILKPSKCVFAGCAVNWARTRNIPVDNWLEAYSTPTLFIQKTSDPAIHYDELEQLLKERKVSNAITEEIPGTDHSYDDISFLRDRIIEFCV